MISIGKDDLYICRDHDLSISTYLYNLMDTSGVPRVGIIRGQKVLGFDSFVQKKSHEGNGSRGSNHWKSGSSSNAHLIYIK